VATAEWLVAIAVAFVTWLVFLPALRGDFLPWDDRANLITNRAWRGIGAAQLQHHMTRARASSP